MGIFDRFRTGEKETAAKKSSNEKDRIELFKKNMYEAAPFYAQIFEIIQLEENENIKTAATNGKIICYNKEFVNKLSEGELNYVLMHELMHIILLHSHRVKERKKELWNIAADFVVNALLDRMVSRFDEKNVAFEKPEGALSLKSYYRESAEKLYDELLKQVDDKEGSEEIFLSIAEKYCSNDMKQENGGMTIPDDLSVAGELSEDQWREWEGIIRIRIKQSLKLWGRMNEKIIPEILFSFTEKRLLNWKKLLKSFIEEVISDDTSFYSPERKYLHMDMIVPGSCYEDDTIKEGWVFIDSSGSISKEEMNRFLSEIYGLLKECRMMLNVAFWDTQVSDVYREISNEQELKKCVPHSFGGTRLECVYAFMERNRINPELIIILTDGCFGRVPDKIVQKWRRKTLVILSKDYAKVQENIGKLARLN